MRKLQVVILCMVVWIGLMMYPSCTKDYLVPVEVVIPDTVSFSQYIIPIFSENCTKSGCHSPGGQAPDLTPANAYSEIWLYGLVDTVDDRSSILYEVMNSTSDPMPPSGKLAGGEDQLVLKWIEQGALDN